MPVSARRLVERFYGEVWNKADEAVAREILHADIRFRGSLGLGRDGVAGFIDYMRSIRAALAGYECIIDDLIDSGSRAAARMRFKGTHSGPLFGVAPTGREISWAGAAFFTIRDGRISELWVLGDIDAVKVQLGAQQTAALS